MVVVRWASLVVLAIVALLPVTAEAGGTGRVRATLTSKIPANNYAGQHVTISWRLRDGAGRPVSVQGVFVKIVCPTLDASTVTYARLVAPGLYRAAAVVPPGGVGTVSIRTKGGIIPITNPYRR